MTSPDPHGSNGFSHGDGYTVMADPSTLPTTGSGGDFDGWDWAMIEASIKGAAAVMNPGPDVTAQALQVSDPQTLFDAANIFYTAQRNLEVVAQVVKDQTEALAGTSGPWQGQAATQFHDTLLSLSNDILGRANQLSGGSSGNGNVPNQLFNDGNFLQWAMYTIGQIDSYYAAQAIQRGSIIGNNAHIAEQPDLKAAMTSDMLHVATQLAQNYEQTFNSLVIPSTSPFNTPAPTNGSPGNINIPPFPSIPAPPPVTVNPPSIPPPPPLAANLPPGLGNLSTAGPGAGAGNVPPFPGGLNGAAANLTPGLGNLSTAGPGAGAGTVPPFPGGLTGPGANGLGNLNGSAGANGLGNVNGPAGANVLGNLAPFPGNLNAPGSANNKGSTKGSGAGLTNFPTGNAPNGTNLSQLGGPGAAGLGNVNGPAAAGLGNVTPFPGNLNGPAGAAGLGNSGLNGLGSGGAGSLNPNAVSPVNFAAGPKAGALGPGLQGPAAGAPPAGAPFLPPMSGAGGAGAGNQRAERPDAAGLLGGVSQPWQASPLTGTGGPHLQQETPSASPASWASGGGVPPLASTAAPGNTASPAPGAAEVSAASGSGAAPGGLPFLPPMSGAGGAGASNQRAERPDAAGLLGGVSQPWQDSAVTGTGDPHLLQETPSASPASWADGGVPAPVSPPAPGSTGSAPGEAVGSPAAVGSGAPLAAEPLIPPGMAGAAGVGAGAADQGAERPDAAGLLAGVSEPWQPGNVGNVGDLGEAGAPAPGLPTAWAVPADHVEIASRDVPVVTAGPDGPVAMAGLDAAVGMAALDAAGSRAAGPVRGGPATSWARGEMVPPPPQIPALDGPAVEPVIPAVGVPPVNTPGMPTEAEPPAEPDDPEPGRLAVVRIPQGRADTSAWSVGTAEFLSLASGSGTGGPGSREAGEPGANYPPASAAGPAETESELESLGLTVYRRRRASEGAEVVDAPLPTCSAGPAPGPGLTAGQQEASEPERAGQNGIGQGDDDDDDEFTVADLLNQDASAWGRRGPGSPGVLE